MSDLTRLLHAALIREQHIDALCGELKHLPDGPTRRLALSRIDARRQARNPAMCVWLRAELDKEEVTCPN